MKVMSDKKFKRNGIILDVISKVIGFILISLIIWRVVITY